MPPAGGKCSGFQLISVAARLKLHASNDYEAGNCISMFEPALYILLCTKASNKAGALDHH